MVHKSTENSPTIKKELTTKKDRPASILAIDIGGTKVKFLASGQTEPRKALSGSSFTPAHMVEAVQQLTEDWTFDVVSIGYPGQVGDTGPRSEPGNLGPGWVGFDFATAFGKPVRIINDAAMQALGSYEGGRMLFLGFGTGLGSALIVEKVLVPLELGNIPYRGNTPLGKLVGRKGLSEIGKKSWRGIIGEIVPLFMKAFLADYVVLGGGNAKCIKELPPGARLGHNLTAFRGGFRLWEIEDARTLSSEEEIPQQHLKPADWRLI